MSSTEDTMNIKREVKAGFNKRPPLWMRIVQKWVGRIACGTLTVEFPDGQSLHVKGSKPGPNATMAIRSPKFVWQVISGGKLGLARAFIDNNWDSPDIGAVLELGILNEDYLNSVLALPALARLLANLRHRLRANTPKGSKRNIAFHYDLGNQFYAQWLDETMTYSSGLFQTAGQSLSDAQNAKYDRIVRQLNIQKNDRVLEIGCGWGGFAEYAVRQTGCSIVGLTLSQEQAHFARERMMKAGLSDRVEIRIEDYRNCEGRFNKIVSVEMFEAVGEENWPVYFARLQALLEADGEALLQVITIDDNRLDQYRNNADFIQTYIFPGGMLPSCKALIDVARRHDLKLTDQLMFGHDYEKTLLQWDDQFIKQWCSIEPLGFDARFKRMWRYYFHYCAAGFRSQRIDVGQFHFRQICVNQA